MQTTRENIIETHTIETRNGCTLKMHTYEVIPTIGEGKSLMYYWYMTGKDTGKHGVWSNAPTMCERVTAHWDGYAGIAPPPPPVAKIGYQFDKWSEVADMIRKAKKEEMSTVAYHKGFLQFHWHGYITCVNGERVGDASFGKNTKTELTREVEDALRDYPNAKIEVSLEGHWDWYEDGAAFKDNDYEPTDHYIDIVLYKNF